MASMTDSVAGKSRGWRRSLPQAQAFLRRRLSEALGVVLFFAALLLFLALMSYDHGDPSWNHVVDAPTRNWVGPYGAHFADVLIQATGLAAMVLPLVLFAWSLRMLMNRGLSALWLRLLVLPICLILASLALAVLAAPGWWPGSERGLGGFFGGT